MPPVSGRACIACPCLVLPPEVPCLGATVGGVGAALARPRSVESALAGKKDERLRACDGEGERGWQSKSLEKVRKAVENGQCLKVALPPGRLGATQEMELAKVKEMGWSYEEVDVFDVLDDQFPRGLLVDAWCEATKSWRRGTVEKQDVVDIEQGDGPKDAVVRWTLRCQLARQIFDSSCICSTSATMKAMQNCFGGAKLRGILMECLPHVDARHRHPSASPRSCGPEPSSKSSPSDPCTSSEIESSMASSSETSTRTSQIPAGRWKSANPIFWKCTTYISRKWDLLTSTSQRARDKLTCHQRERLSAIKGSDMVRLSAPAGAGKTFVAVERVIDL